MQVRLYDRARNVSLAARPGLDDPFAALDDLLSRASGVSDGQHEFECDGEFADACQAADSEDAPRLVKPPEPWKPGHEATYQGVPLIVSREVATMPAVERDEP